jgi:hypothetical protein
MSNLRRSGFNRITRGRPDQEAVRAMAIGVRSVNTLLA